MKVKNPNKIMNLIKNYNKKMKIYQNNKKIKVILYFMDLHKFSFYFNPIKLININCFFSVQLFFLCQILIFNLFI